VKPRRSLVWWAVAAVTACGLAATAHGMYAVAMACGVSQPVAVLYPVLADGLALAAYASTTRLKSWSQFYAWVVVVVAANLSGFAQGWHLASLTDQPGTTWALRFGMGYGVAVVCTVAAHLLWLVGRSADVPAAVPYAGGSDPLDPESDPSAPDSIPALADSNGNGHAVTLKAQAERAALDYLKDNGVLPSENVLAGLARCSRGTARNALAPLKKG